MPDIIQLLPDHVANQIAAGEVVQRPASVVKELLENAIDAGATDIKLLVKDAGKALIQVIDNGSGMSGTDARLCFERHATSKIKSSDDLFRLHTKGFRGEALASIAAVAQVELKTKTETAEVGSLIKIEGSEVMSQEAVVTPQGSSLAVKNLFFNVPARRNFLKSNSVETRHIIDEFHRVALAHPDVSFSLRNNGTEVFRLPAANLKQRIVGIFGSKTNEKLVPVEEKTELVGISGFVVKPQFAKKTRGGQFFFVNNRFVKNSYLHHAVSAAFEGLLREGCQPGYFLFLEVPPQSIDINIHPTKTEIKFEDEHAIYAMLRATVKHSLGQFNVAPALDFERDKSLDTPYEYAKKEARQPQVTVDPDFNPFSESGQMPSRRAVPSAQWESLYTETQQADFPIHTLEVESQEVTGTLFEETETGSQGGTFQLQGKYIITPIKDGLIAVHQQRAHERILYEELLGSISGRQPMSQQLLFPIEISFTPMEIALLSEIKESLESTGFAFDYLEGETARLGGVPVQLVGSGSKGVQESQLRNVLEQLLTDMQNEVPDAGFSQNDLLAKSLARTLSIKSGTQLPRQQQENLVNRLFACKDPTVSPGQKRTFVRIEAGDLERRFE